MNTKAKLLKAIEQAPDSLIEETLNFILSARSEYVEAKNVGDEILSLLDQIPLNSEDLENLPTDLAAQHDHYLYGIPKCD